MGQTTNFDLPYPELSDTPNGPDQIGNLAQVTDTSLTLIQLSVNDLQNLVAGPRVTALPSSPVDGQRARLQPDPSGVASLLWDMVYDSDLALWIFGGGQPMIARVEGACTRTNSGDNGYTNPDGGASGPTITAPFAGTYRYRVGSRIGAAADGQEAATGVSIAAGSVSDDAAAANYNTRTASCDTGWLATGHIAASATLVQKYRNNGSSQPATFANRFIEFLPLTIDAT